MTYLSTGTSFARGRLSKFYAGLHLARAPDPRRVSRRPDSPLFKHSRSPFLDQSLFLPFPLPLSPTLRLLPYTPPCGSQGPA